MESMEGFELMKAQAHVFNHVFNFISSMSLKCAVQLDIPDTIHNHGQPMTLPNLVEALSLAPSRTPHLHRLMRLLVHSGFFAIHKNSEEEEGYMLTPPSKLLLNNKSVSLKPLVLNLIDPVIVTPYHVLSDWFKGNDATAFETANAMSFWDYVVQHKEVGDYMNEAMASETSIVMAAVVKECKEVFEGLGSLVDVGGGTGTASRVLAEAFPDLKCLVFDLPHVVADLPKRNNLEFVGGNMFESVPSADAIFIKSVLHNWSDEDCVRILKRCRESLASKENAGKVILIEFVMDNNEGDYEATESGFFLDLLMMVLVNGKQRTEKEWEKLFLESGFSHYKISHVLGLRSLIEVFP